MITSAEVLVNVNQNQMCFVNLESPYLVCRNCYLTENIFPKKLVAYEYWEFQLCNSKIMTNPFVSPLPYYFEAFVGNKDMSFDIKKTASQYSEMLYHQIMKWL